MTEFDPLTGEPLAQPTINTAPKSPAYDPLDDPALIAQQSPDVSIDLLVRKLELARKLAMKNEEPAAATAAIMAMAKLHGLLVDKRETTFKRIEDMTESELRQMLGDEFEEDLKLGNGLAIEHQPEPDDN